LNISPLTGQPIAPARSRSVDLTPYRGQRVFLTIGIHAENEGAALVDDIQLR
jgi:hypothetical protein